MLVKSITSSLIFLLSLIENAALSAQTQSADNISLNDKRPRIEILKFDQEPNVGFPIDFYDEFAAIVADKLKESEKFSKVISAYENDLKVSDKTDSEINKTPPEVRYRLTVMISHYSTDKATSWLLLGLRGQEIIIVRISLLDKITGKVILEKKVDGSTSFNYRRIETPRNITMRGVAKQAVRNIKKAIDK